MMAKNRSITPIPIDTFVFSLVINSNGVELARYGLQHRANLLENAELTENIIDAYETYFKSINSRLHG